MRPIDAWPRYGALVIPPPGPFPRNRDLEDVVRASESREPLLVWADWLHEQEDARGLALHLLATRATPSAPGRRSTRPPSSVHTQLPWWGPRCTARS